MRILGRVVLLLVVGAMTVACSMNGQVQRSADTQWSSHYQKMHDMVQHNNPEMDHVLTFCNEMIKVSAQYEQHAITRQQFVAKQNAMRELLKREDEYRQEVKWNNNTASVGPMEQYLQATYEGTKAPEAGVSSGATETVSSETSSTN